jgi:hypothetical protein
VCGVILAAIGVLLASSVTAAAIAPVLSTVSAQSRRPAASFSTPRAGSVTVYVASRPDRATNGRFLDENVKDIASLTTSEIQSGYWASPSRVDPGSYWLMLDASADFASCYIVDLGGFDPGCADGFSQVLPLSVPRPLLQVTTRATVYSGLGEVDVRITAHRLGENLRYRVCYRNARRVRRCLNGVLAGFSWDFPASDTLSVRTRTLPRVTTFTWYARGRVVASRRVRVR